MTALKRVVRPGTIEEIRAWILGSRPPGASVVMDARYFVLCVPERGRVAAVGLKKLSWFATEVKHLVVKPDERRNGYGRAILRLALERIPTPLAIATVRADNAHWLRANVEEGFREVETLGSEGNEVRFLVHRVRGGEAAPTPEADASPAQAVNTGGGDDLHAGGPPSPGALGDPGVGMPTGAPRRERVLKEFASIGNKYRIRLLQDPECPGESPTLDIREYVSGRGDFEGFTRRGIKISARADLALLRDVLNEILERRP